MKGTKSLEPTSYVGMAPRIRNNKEALTAMKYVTTSPVRCAEWFHYLSYKAIKNGLGSLYIFLGPDSDNLLSLGFRLIFNGADEKIVHSVLSAKASHNLTQCNNMIVEGFTWLAAAQLPHYVCEYLYALANEPVTRAAPQHPGNYVLSQRDIDDLLQDCRSDSLK